jgi:carbon monoxide dehydrogenase subunit G
LEIRQEFTIDLGLVDLWKKLADAALVARCVPGFELGSISDDQTEIKGRIRVRIGPMNAAFAGAAKITRNDQEHSGTLEGSGVDDTNGSRAAVKLTYSITSAGDQQTNVSVVAAVALSGLIAQFGKTALIKEIASQLTAEFVRRLQVALADTTDKLSSAPPTAVNEIRLLNVLAASFKARVPRLLARISLFRTSR